MRDMIPRRTHFTLVLVKGMDEFCMKFECQFETHSTKKVIGITTLSRKDHLTAQTREIACTRDVLPSVLSYGRLKY